ncbi:MAG TPA: TIGR01777 family oxidoreductase [Pyrinomonadaceae bacterium]|nr:TIGR01777 family oxidoreductase [Pyrinomonadaceae bacterium]
MKILITGASGLLGENLQKSFLAKGHELLLATRHKPENDNQIYWNIEKGFRDEDFAKLETLDAVVHLAGETITGRWSEEKKKKIRDSRVFGTRSLVDAFSKLAHKPKVFVSASAIGFYGDRNDEELTESSAVGDTFLAKTCAEWEAEARRAEDLGIRTVLVRTGIVLAKEGGALGQMLTPFKFGVGGVVGSGKQWMSWISLEDEIEIFNFALENESVRGAINATAPHPVTNEEFTKTLGEVISRPTILPLPEFAVKLVFGEMGDALLLDSTKVLPKRLKDYGFNFKFENLKDALEDAVK